MFPLSGAPAARICRLMGWEVSGAAYWTLIEHFETLNAIERFREAYPWSAVRARIRFAAFLAESFPDGRLTVVALGRKAADAARLPGDLPWGEWRSFMGYDATVIPHTSGRSRVWNDGETEAMVKRVLTEAIERAKT